MSELQSLTVDVQPVHVGGENNGLVNLELTIGGETLRSSYFTQLPVPDVKLSEIIAEGVARARTGIEALARE